MFEHPRVTEQLCREIADRHRESNIAVVIGPTTGKALLAQEVARQLHMRCMIAEPASTGGLELGRGLVLQTGTRVLVVDDVLNTGLTVCETLKALQAFHPEIIGIEVMIDRSRGGQTV